MAWIAIKQNLPASQNLEILNRVTNECQVEASEQKSPREPHLSATLYCLFFMHLVCELRSVVVNAVVFQPSHLGRFAVGVRTRGMEVYGV